MKRSPVVIISLGLLALVIVALPFAATNYLLRLTTIGFMYVALASSWNIVGGFTGYPSFATAAFFGIGAYASGILRSSGAFSLPLSWLLGASAATVFSLIGGRDPSFARALFCGRKPGFSGGAAGDHQCGHGPDRGRHGPQSADHGNVDVDAQARLYYASMLAAAGLRSASPA